MSTARPASIQPRAAFVGRTTADAIYWLRRLPEEDTKVFARQFRIAPGGPACNAAITHALLGGETILVSAIGSGPIADLVRRNLHSAGVGLVDLAPETGYDTPLATVLIGDSGRTRTIVNPPAATVEFHAPQAWSENLGSPPAIVLTDGFHLPEVLPLLRNLHALGSMLVLDGGSWKPGTGEVTALLTVAICGERFCPPGCDSSPEATIAWFLDRGVQQVAITRGPRSILACDGTSRFEIEVQPILAVDTLGAGDVLHGAFCYQFAKCGDFRTAIERAAESATRSCTGPGIDHWITGR